MGEIDVSVFWFLHRTFSGGWIPPLAFLSVIGGGWGALFAVPLLAIARTRRAARVLVGVLAVTAILVFAIKQMVGRVRPCNCLADVSPPYRAPTDFSFPSGHASGSFAFCVFLAVVLVKTTPASASVRERLLRQLAAGALVLLAALVGLSRIALGVHFPGDVVAGAILGSAAALIGAAVHLRGRMLG